MEDIEEEIPMTAQYLLQQEENTILKAWTFPPCLKKYFILICLFPCI